MQAAASRIAFIGTGQMAVALACGFTRTLLRPENIFGCDPVDAARARFEETVGAGVTVRPSPSDVVSDSTVVILAVKPQMMSEVLDELSPLLRPDQLVVSVAAGVPLARLAAGLPAGTRIIRVMPNTPCLIGRGACGMSLSETALPEDARLMSTLLETVGIVEMVPEKHLDIVTGLSGSGPAYVFQIIEALSDGGVRMGLPRAAATRLAAQTVLGAAEMVLETGRHPAELKDGVTSPGGTTIAGIHALERSGLRAALMNAVEAATLRSMELGK